MYISINQVLSIASLISVIAAAIGVILACYRWFLRQNAQDKEISKIKDEQCLIVYGLIACLDGLEQQGCNHKVTEAKSKLEKHLNVIAHE